MPRNLLTSGAAPALPRLGSARRAFAAFGLAIFGVLSLLASYVTCTNDLVGGFHRGWLFWRIDHIPGEGALRGAGVELERGLFGRVLVVRLRSGEVKRWRLSFGVMSIRDPDRLIEHVDAETRDP